MRFRGRRFVAAAALVVLAGAAFPADDLPKILKNLARAADPKERKELVAQLATDPGAEAADRLRDLVRTDPDVGVRVAAAEALGASPVVESTKLLLQLVGEGGTHDVRRAVAKSLAKRRATEQVAALVERAGDDELGIALVLETLALDPSLDAAEALERFARSENDFVRPTALRALAKHPIGAKQVGAVLVDSIGKHHDEDTLLAALDVGDVLGEQDLRQIVELLDTFLEPEVQAAVEAAKRRLAWIDAHRATKKAKKEGYGVAPGTYGDDDEPPPPRPRLDALYVFDETGSVCGQIDAFKKRIKRDILTMAHVGCDVRVAIIAFTNAPLRGGLATRVLPLTYDLARADQFLASARAEGTDTKDETILWAMRQALDRMDWRWQAQRHVTLIADERTGAGRKCADLARLHFQADRSRIDVLYNYRTRPQLPPDIDAIAKVTGGVVESFE